LSIVLDELLHFGSDGKCDIVLNCDPMWASNLIQIAGSEQVNLTAVAYNAGTGVLAIPASTKAFTVTTGTNPSPLTANTINVNITDLKLYICRAHVSSSYVPRGITSTVYMKGFCPYYNQLTSPNTTILAPFKQDRRITHIAIAFVTGKGNPFKYSPTDFSKQFQSVTGGYTEVQNTADVQSSIQQVTISIGGVQYPQSTYNLTTQTTGTSNTYDTQKAYEDYCVFTDAMRDRNG